MLGDDASMMWYKISLGEFESYQSKVPLSPLKMSTKKLVLIIGATGIQGRPCVSAMLARQDDGTPSPYSVRVLTRDPTSEQAKGLASLGAELFQGSCFHATLMDISAQSEYFY